MGSSPTSSVNRRAKAARDIRAAAARPATVHPCPGSSISRRSAGPIYAHTIMPGLATVDDRTFVGAFQALDRAILNPWFLGGSFLGTAVLGVAAGVLGRGRPELVWIAAAVALHLVVVAITVVVHLPLNDALEAAAPTADPAAVRAAFDETRWRGWNLVRTTAAVLEFALLAGALVVQGRAGR